MTSRGPESSSPGEPLTDAPAPEETRIPGETRAPKEAIAQLAVLETATIRRMRGSKPQVDPWRAHGVIDEPERLGDGTQQSCRTVFLAGAECPFTCVFCDLWQFTVDGPTPDGALVSQLERALTDAASSIDCLKLYNASNFFDPRAVPSGDLPQIADLASAFNRVVVECHPRLIDRGAVDFAARLDGKLELALGLETSHPAALAALNKQMTLDDFDRACDFAQRHDLDLRAFVLIGAPYIAVEEAGDWIERSVKHAIDQGVGHVSLIPVRAGNGALDALAESGAFTPPSQELIEDSFAAALETAVGQCIVTLDLWDIEHHVSQPQCCAGARVERLREMNASGAVLPDARCSRCLDTRA